jgi:hypothetical protein
MALQIRENKKKEVVITLSGKIDPEQVEQAMRYLRYLALTSTMKKVTQAEVDALAAEVKHGMARKRRKKLAS